MLTVQLLKIQAQHKCALDNDVICAQQWGDGWKHTLEFHYSSIVTVLLHSWSNKTKARLQIKTIVFCIWILWPVHMSTIGCIAMTFSTIFHISRRMTSINFSDHLTFPLKPPSGLGFGHCSHLDQFQYRYPTVPVRRCLTLSVIAKVISVVKHKTPGLTSIASQVVIQVE